MSKVFTADEVKKHTTRSSVWMVIRNDVYDVTSFLGEHPGGEDPLMEAGGQDATIAFDDVGHSADARSMLKKYKIGSLAPGKGCCKMKPKVWRPSSKYHRECTACDVNSDTIETRPSFASTSFHSDEKPWLRYTMRVSPRPSTKSMKSNYKVPVPPRAERRVQRIVVPIEPSPRRPRGPPCGSSSKLKWALLALGLAIIIGVAYKKYAT